MNIKQFKALIAEYNAYSSAWNRYETFHIADDGDDIFILFTKGFEGPPLMIWIHGDDLAYEFENTPPSTFRTKEGFLVDEFEHFILKGIFYEPIKFKTPFKKMQIR